jgi:hypothetical protein
MTNATAVVRPLPGPGLVARAGDLLLVCAEGGDELDDLLGLVTEVAAAGGDGGVLVRRVAALLAADFDGRFPACAASGPTRDGRFAVLVYGAATADVVSGDGDITLAGSDAITSVNRLVAGPVSVVRLQLPGAGPAHPRSHLDAGVVGAAGVVYSVGGTAGGATLPPLRPDPAPAIPMQASAPESDLVAPVSKMDAPPVPVAEPVFTKPTAPAAPSYVDPSGGLPPFEVPSFEAPPVAMPPAFLPPPVEVAAAPVPVSAPPVPLPPLEMPPHAPPLPPVPVPSAAPASPTAPPAAVPMPAVPMPAAPMPAAPMPAAAPPPPPAVPLPPVAPPFASPMPAPLPEPAPEPVASPLPAPSPLQPPQLRQPDPSAPFVAVLLLPGVDSGEVEEPPAPVLDLRPRVLGVLCKNDHFNDPSLRYCSVCGISMAQQTLVKHEGPRPPLGVLLLDDGSTFRLDVDYVVGREPQQDPEVVSGTVRPLRITDTAGVVSRRHLRVALVGWDVQVVDLGSANGTFVAIPGGPERQQLVANQPVVVRPGTQITMGRRWFRYESHRNP